MAGRLFLIAASAVIMLLGAGLADAEELIYDIFKDGDPIGQEVVRIDTAGPETKVTVTTATDVKVLFLSFTYRHQRQEVWRDGTLVGFTAKTDDDGTPHDIAMTDNGRGYDLTVDGEPRQADARTLPLTLWTDAILDRTTLLSVVDARPYAVQIDAKGSEALTIDGREVAAQRYSMTGDIKRELWYDTDGKLLKTAFERKGFGIEFIRKPHNAS